MGILVKLVDRFFGSLKKGLSDSYKPEADKSGVDPGVAAHMKKMEIYNRLITKQWEKYK